MTELSGGHVLFLNWRDTKHPEGGGSELFLDRVAAEFVRGGYLVTLLCQAHGNAPAEETTPDGVRIIRRGGRHTVYLLAAITYLIGLLGIGPLARRRLGRPDLIIDVGNGIPFLSRLYARVPVIALVHHVHREQWPVVFGPRLARVGWWIESRLAVRVYRDCQYVTVSESTREELVGLGVDRHRIAVVHNGTPEVTEPPAPRTPHPSLMVLGRLVPHKRVEFALRATALLALELPGVELVVAGQGWWDEPLRQLTEDLGIEERVRFTGFVSEQEKHELLCGSWLLLAPSLKEGWGLTIVEAGVRGTPSVAFRSAGGVADAMVDGETGVLVENEYDFFLQVRALLLDAVRRGGMGAAAAVHAKQFTWENAGETFGKVVARQLSGEEPAPVDQRVA
ncbi:glycosyltransferase involved in cell wall biosynthesis [Actinoplanes campanulatus]|uniref:Glycosyltransferase involved in cell wall biosynthesis n=1 Tax=Actinoplanes campanulatus TaxID=113559 RepID=A0A7W5ACM8_9ACTN|nr:glycosyltransferase family 4 protein [Actinoplanes campanulatus]MBB3093853.1 glycosyltransferase involved in cell wall biosynthesis [Actinoplanes campanulatus]GGN06082.1 glycosyl hydrolase [Actinoplanes campanulatus]GID35072.1 glycosyl hydrolase [Actinoplanes campanulatus]